MPPYGYMCQLRSLWPTLRSQEVNLSPIEIHVLHAFYQIFSYAKDFYLNFWGSNTEKECLGHTNIIQIVSWDKYDKNQKIKKTKIMTEVSHKVIIILYDWWNM